MTLHEKLGIVACAGHLALAILVLMRRTKTSLALPLSLLCIDLFVWNFADLAWDMTGNAAWRKLDTAVSWLTPPLALHVVAAFVGRARGLRSVLLVTYLFFAQLPFWADRPGWDLVFLGGVIPSMAFALVLLAVHLARTSDVQEKLRTALILSAIAVGTILGSSDLWYDHVGFTLPLSNIGTLASTLLVAVAALRLNLIWRDVPSRAVLLALAGALVALVGYLSVVRAFATQRAMLVLAALTAVFVLVALGREALLHREVQRGRSENLALLGRFSQQMAHDLKNPLAALKGALQFLKEEARQGRSLDEQSDFLDLMLEQIARVQRVVEQYQRMGRVEPARAPVELNEVVRDVLKLQPFAATDRIRVEASLGESLPVCYLDKDLLALALENLVQNALEAMPQGGTVRVRTERAPGKDDAVVLLVADSGAGMDVRQIEHAFDEFYTTKPQGSGLGLAFVRRVARAHGGEAKLESTLGQGTLVRVELPIGELGNSMHP
jgi:two-component system, NtrC family, sensor histidine kinase HydH